MENKALDIQRPGLIELVLDFQTMSVWELLRRYNKPLSIAEIAEWVASEPAIVRSGIDKLLEFSLLKTVPAGGRRKTVTFRTTPQKLQVAWDANDPKDKALIERIVQRLKTYNAELFEDGSFQKRPRKKGDWHKFFCTPVCLNETDLAELRRRIGEVVDFVNMIIDTPAYDEKKEGVPMTPPPLCNYNISIRVQPLHHPLPPQPNISIVPRVPTENKVPKKSELGETSRLSHREKQIAAAIVGGGTQPEIARQLGLSRHTVGTFVKRIYQKLGVHNQIELVNKMRGFERSGGR